MPKIESPPFQHPERKLTRLYITALSAVALLSIIGQLLIQRTLKNQLTDARVINIAGKQRYKSQEICKLVLIANFNYNHKEYSDVSTELQQLVKTWEIEHAALEHGNDSLEIADNNSATIKRMFSEINPYFKTIADNAYLVAQSGVADKAVVKNAIKSIMDNEQIFLSKMNAIVMQYDLEAREKVITLRRTESILLIVTLIILFIEGLFIFRPAVNQLKISIQKLIASENAASKLAQDLQIVNEKIKESFDREQRIKAASLIEGQEEERKVISMELHDGLIQTIASLKRGLESIYTTSTDNLKTQIENIVSIANESIKEARRISHNLMPSALYDLGIASAIKHLASNVSEQSGIKINFSKSNNIIALNNKMEIHLYRITQEALSNIVKYSKADDVTIRLEQLDKKILLTIIDNGEGFDTSKLLEDRSRLDSGNGISNIRERVNIMNGSFKIESVFSKGTKLTIVLTGTTVS